MRMQFSGNEVIIRCDLIEPACCAARIVPDFSTNYLSLSSWFAAETQFLDLSQNIPLKNKARKISMKSMSEDIPLTSDNRVLTRDT